MGKPCETGVWFAWRPVRLGALGTGPVAWLRPVWFATAMGVTIYQSLETAKSTPVVREYLGRRKFGRAALKETL